MMVPTRRHKFRKAMVSAFILGLIMLAATPCTHADVGDVRIGSIVILGEEEEIRFVNIDRESFISWVDLQEALPWLFSISTEGKIEVNSDVVMSFYVSLLDTPKPANPVTTRPQVIESRIEGDFNGWDGETIFKLDNGQIWQQVGYSYYYTYKYRPEVVIYLTSKGYVLRVDGVEKDIRVVQLR